MKLLTAVLVSHFLSFGIGSSCSSQEKDYVAIINSIKVKLEKSLGHKYYVSGINVDESVNGSAHATAKIADSYHTLAGCFVFLADGARGRERKKPNGFVGIYKITLDSILWRSAPLTSSFSSGAMASVSGVRELNDDGKIEILISQGKEPRGTIEQLWIFSWDGVNGKLITKLDEDGESTIMCYGDHKLTDVDRDGVLEIQGKWYLNENSDKKTAVTYSWNGSLYGNWGKTSKYFLKDKRR